MKKMLNLPPPFGKLNSSALSSAACLTMHSEYASLLLSSPNWPFKFSNNIPNEVLLSLVGLTGDGSVLGNAGEGWGDCVVPSAKNVYSPISVVGPTVVVKLISCASTHDGLQHNRSSTTTCGQR